MKSCPLSTSWYSFRSCNLTPRNLSGNTHLNSQHCSVRSKAHIEARPHLSYEQEALSSLSSSDTSIWWVFSHPLSMVFSLALSYSSRLTRKMKKIKLLTVHIFCFILASSFTEIPNLFPRVPLIKLGRHKEPLTPAGTKYLKV